MSLLVPEQDHDRLCWCNKCFFKRCERPDLFVEDFREYAEDLFQEQYVQKNSRKGYPEGNS